MIDKILTATAAVSQLKHKIATMLAVTALAFGLSSSALASNLVVNGGFETGDFTGWTQSGNLNYTTVYDNSGYKWWALSHSGDYRGVLGPDSGTGTLTQNLITTSGNHYTLSFWLANDSAPLHNDTQFGNSFAVSWDGQALKSLPDVGMFAWKTYVYNVAATGPVSTLQFSFFNYIGYYYLDDVSVSANGLGPNAPLGQVPEPFSALLLGSGLAGIGGSLRRKPRK